MVSVGGIGSGIDFSPLIDGFVAAERAPISGLEARKASATRQKSTLATLVGRLKTLETKAKALDEARKLSLRSATSSNSESLKVEASSTAADGRYVIDVQRLASAQSNASRVFAGRDAGALGTGTLSIAVGSGTPVEFSFDATTSLDDLAAAIGSSALNLNAAVINDGQGFRLLVTGKDTGVANSIQFGTVSGDSVGLESNQLVAAQDAEIRINGLAVTRAANEASDIIQGVKLEFRATTGPSNPVTVQVSADTQGMQNRVQELVEAYNDVVKLVRSELGKGAESRTGSLFGDSSAQALQRRLSALVSEGFVHDGETHSLNTVGLKVQQGGVLSLDSSAFTKALTSDPSRLSSLLVGDGVTSLTARLKSVVADYATPGTGVLFSKQAGIDSRIKSYDRQIEQIDGRATRLGERLRRTFASLDQSLSQLNAQSSYLATLNRSSNY